MILSKARKLHSKNNYGPVLQRFDSPFAHLDSDEMEDVRKAMSDSMNEVYNSALNSLNRVLKQSFPPSALAVLSYYYLTAGVGPKGLVKYNESGIDQAHLEYLQALSLCIDPNDISNELVSGESIEELNENLVNLFHAASYKQLSESKSDSPEDRAIAEICAFVMLHTLSVRNWGYQHQIKKIVSDIYFGFDGLVDKELGFTLSAVFSVFEFLVLLYEERITRWIAILKELRSISNKAEQLTFFKSNGSFVPEYFIDEELVLRLDESQRLAYYMNISDPVLFKYLAFDAPSVVEISRRHGNELDLMEVERILNHFALPFGGLADYDINHFFLSNPIKSKPFIDFNGGFYFSPAPYSFFGSSSRTFDSLVTDKDALNLQKSRYLEKSIVELLSSIFPADSIYPSVTWKLNGVRYETDVILLYQKVMIVIEAKSHTITNAALRGAKESVRSAVNKLIIDPNVQSRRFKDSILKIKNGEDISFEFIDVVPDRVFECNYIYRLSVTLDDFATIQANILKHKDTNWFPKEFQSCPTMTLAELDTVLDVLEKPLFVFHYLKKRTELENGKVHMFGYEMQQLGMYLSNHFEMNLSEDLSHFLGEMQGGIDNYYESQGSGYTISKPTVTLTALFSDLLFHTRKSINASMAIMNVSPDNQRMIEVKLKKIRKQVLKKRRNNGRNGLHYRSIGAPNVLLVFLCFAEEQFLEIDDHVSRTMRQISTEMDVSQEMIFIVYRASKRLMTLTAVYAFDIDEDVRSTIFINRKK